MSDATPDTLSTPSPPARGGGANLDLGGFSGLSEDDARRRLEQDGPNELPTQKKRGLFAIALEVVREPMFLMLVAAGSLYFFMGEPGDALMLLSFVFVVMAITIIQERRTERALDALRDLSSPRALVIRGGAHRRIPGREVVRGDILVLSEGDRVPADAIMRRAINLSVDESLLTGESVPVRKTPSATAQDLERPGGDDLPSVFSGTLVTAGQGIAEVVCTGFRTELGKIGKALQQVQPEATLAPEGDAPIGPHVRHGRAGRLRRRCRALRPPARGHGGGLERGTAGRHRLGHGHAAGGVSGRAHGLPGPGRLAHLAQPGADAADARHRDAGGGHGPVRRQDGDAHAEPDDAETALCGGPDD